MSSGAWCLTRCSGSPAEPIDSTAMRRPIVLLLLATASPVLAQAPVPMHEEPLHRLVLTHKQLRVMDVQIRPGDTTQFHVHDVPALFVAVSASPVDLQVLDGRWEGIPPGADPGRKPGDVSVDTSYVRHPVTHRVTNVGSQLFNLIAITSSTVSPVDSGPTEMPGGLEFHGRWFTQSRARVSAGADQRWYSAPSPTVVVKPEAGAATVVLESGETHVLSAPGSWALIPAGSRYRFVSADSATLVFVRVR